MPEYIEKEAIEYPYMTMTLWGLNNATCKAYNEGVKAAADAIAAMPAADVVAVVRCKDCYNWDEERKVGHAKYGNETAPCYEWSNLEDGHTRYTKSTDFCSYGERRADNATD